MKIFLGENKYADPQDFREVIHVAKQFEEIEIVRWDVNISASHNHQKMLDCDILLLLTDVVGPQNDGMYAEATIGKGTYGMAVLKANQKESDDLTDLSMAQIYFYSDEFVWPAEEVEPKGNDNWRDYALIYARLDSDQSPETICDFFYRTVGARISMNKIVSEKKNSETEKYESGSDPFADY